MHQRTIDGCNIKVSSNYTRTFDSIVYVLSVQDKDYTISYDLFCIWRYVLDTEDTQFKVDLYSRPPEIDVVLPGDYTNGQVTLPNGLILSGDPNDPKKVKITSGNRVYSIIPPCIWKYLTEIPGGLISVRIIRNYNNQTMIDFYEVHRNSGIDTCSIYRVEVNPIELDNGDGVWRRDPYWTSKGLIGR